MPLDDPLDVAAHASAAVEATDHQNLKVEQLEKSRAAWSRLQQSDWGKQILSDLEGMIQPYKSLVRSDTEMTHVALGRHEVWLFIQERLTMTDEDIVRMIEGATP